MKTQTAEKLTVRKFMLKKFPPNKYIDCPVPKHHWEVIQEYTEEYAEQQSLELLEWMTNDDELTIKEVYEQFLKERK